MNRNTLTIGSALLVAIIVAFGIAIYLQRGDGGPEPITGPGRAAEARGIIADIEARRGAEARTPAAAPALIGNRDINTRDAGAAQQAGAAGQDVGGGAIAVTPERPAAAPAGADAELEEAFEQALELQAAGQLDDAQVLLYFGARRGHARSAFAYAEINDPNHHSAETSLLAEPDAFQAFRWYSAARDGGIGEAAARLDALKVWAEQAAAAGDSEAERLLLQWE